MSTLWTPSGERPIRRGPPEAAPAHEAPGGPAEREPGAQPSREELQAQMAELQARLAKTPAEVVVANHAYGLFELATLHLAQKPPQLPQARLAIDAMAALVEGLRGRLGEDEPRLTEGLSQLRLAFVELSRSTRGGPAAPSSAS